MFSRIFPWLPKRYNYPLYLILIWELFLMFDTYLSVAVKKLEYPIFCRSILYVTTFVLLGTVICKHFFSRFPNFQDVISLLSKPINNLNFYLTKVFNILLAIFANIHQFVPQLIAILKEIDNKQKALEQSILNSQIAPQMNSGILYKIPKKRFLEIVIVTVLLLVLFALSYWDLSAVYAYSFIIYIFPIVVLFFRALTKNYTFLSKINDFFNRINQPCLYAVSTIFGLIILFVSAWYLGNLQHIYLCSGLFKVILCILIFNQCTLELQKIHKTIEEGEEGEELVLQFLRELNYNCEYSINYPRRFLQENRRVKRWFLQHYPSRPWLSILLSSLGFEYLFFKGDIDFFISGYPLRDSLSILIECKSTQGKIKIKIFDDSLKPPVLGFKKPRKSINPFHRNSCLTQLIKEQAQWLQSDKNLYLPPIPVIVFTQAILELEGHENIVERVDGFYLMKSNRVWLITLQQLGDWLEYINQQEVSY